MPVIDTRDIAVLEKLPGWRGRIFHSSGATFGHWEFDAGSIIHEHFHPQEEVWHVVEGEVELTIGGEKCCAGPGIVAIVPPNTPHSARALSDGKAIVADNPRRPDFG
jgi:quercetin dioxygenase-like cupin family protein